MQVRGVVSPYCAPRAQTTGAAPVAATDRFEASAPEAHANFWHRAGLAACLGFAAVGALGLSGCAPPPGAIINSDGTTSYHPPNSSVIINGNGSLGYDTGHGVVLGSDGRVGFSVGNGVTINSDGTTSWQIGK